MSTALTSDAPIPERLRSHSRAERLTQTLPLPYAVGFFFSFRLFIMLLAVRVLGLEPDTGVAIGLVLNILLLVVTAFGTLGAVGLPIRHMLHLGPVRWAFFYLAFTGASLAWTSAVSLTAAASFWAAMAADLLMVVLMLRSAADADVRTATIHSILKGYVAGACLVALIAWLLPTQSDLRLGDEELMGANAIGYACGFALLWAQYLLRERDGRWRIAAAVLGLTMLRSLSKTTIIAFAICQVFLLVRDNSMSRKAKLRLALIALVILAVFWPLLSSYYTLYMNTGQGDQAETLTGRVGIWAYMLAEAIEQPWIGHGFHSVWHVIPPFGGDRFEARHAHNELIQQFYAYGAVGILMFFGIYRSLWSQLRKLPASPRKLFFYAVLIFILIRGLADTEVFDLSLPIWMTTLISVLLSDTRHRGAWDSAKNEPACLSP